MYVVNEDAQKKTQQILDMDAMKLANEIAKGHISSVNATETYITHLKQINPSINCLVEDRFATAREEAIQADQMIKEGNMTRKLLGVPISMKEAFDVSGMKTTGGLHHRSSTIEQEDAEIVKKLRGEGAIILGKTNTPTLCFCQESDNKLYGRTNNPWDKEKTAGGSSGGEGALIAVGGAAVGIGSDIGGSIRFPSHFNGVIGFKSGNGQVSQKGSFPFVVHPLQERMLGIGPMSKTVADSRFIYQLIAKNDDTGMDVNDDFTIEILPNSEYPLSMETKIILKEINDTLKEWLQTKQTIPPYFHESALLWQEIMSIDGGKNTAQSASPHKKFNPLKEFLLEKTTGTSDYHSYLSWALIGARIFKPNNKRVKEIEKIVMEGDKIINKYLEKRILILPVYHRTAPEHGKLYQEIFSIKKTFLKFMPHVAYANVWGLPSLTLPVWEDQEGMPIGVQIISKNGNEEAIFQVGEWLEKKFGGYRRCTKYDK